MVRDIMNLHSEAKNTSCMRILDLTDAKIRNKLHPLERRSVFVFILSFPLLSVFLFLVYHEVLNRLNVVAHWIVTIHELNDDLSKVFDINVRQLNFGLLASAIPLVVGWILLGQWLEVDFEASKSHFDMVVFLAWKGYSLSDLSNDGEFTIAEVLACFHESVIRNGLSFMDGLVSLLNDCLNEDPSFPVGGQMWMLVHGVLML